MAKWSAVIPSLLATDMSSILKASVIKLFGYVRVNEYTCNAIPTNSSYWPEKLANYFWFITCFFPYPHTPYP